MGKFLVSQRQDASETMVSNRFLEVYMPFCNELQLKVYLLVLRSAQAGETTGIPEIADLCNDTEREVMRALQYWEKLNVLSLNYGDGPDPVGVQVNPLQEAAAPPAPPSNRIGKPEAAELSPVRVSAIEVPETPVCPLPYEKKDYTDEEIDILQRDEAFCRLLFVAEQYQGRPLMTREVDTLLFLYDVCHLPQELIDYLMEYCIEKGKTDFRYIEAVGLSWAKNGITTKEEALQFSGKYDKFFYSVMKALGKREDITDTEARFITKWTKEWGFSSELIMAACEQTVLSTDSHRLKYCDRILESWKNEGIRSLPQLEEREMKHRGKQAAGSKEKPANNNAFNQYTQTRYDFKRLEALISNH